MFRIIRITLLLSALSLTGQEKITPLVNPFIGTGGHGHTFPGAVLPFGMVQLSPDTRVDNSWDGASGYHYSDDRIYGFSHTHLSGTGVSDFGDILVMPVTGTPSVRPVDYSSAFSHTTEKASPGFYEVLLEDDKIKAELTVTPRVGIHRYSFPGKAGNIVLDLLHRDKVLDCGMVFVDSVTVVGHRISEAWATKQHCYFAMKFSKPYTSKHIANKGAFIQRLGKFPIRPENGVFVFDLSDGKPLIVKLAISPVSFNNARKNLEAEAPHWEFEKYKFEAQQAWEQQLRKVELRSGSKEERTIFYTALYHAFIHPSLNMDVDSSYRGRDNRIHMARGFTNYSVFSLWDTYRALHPLFTIFETKRTSHFIRSFLAQYDQAGRLPVWELASNETDCMIGFHSVSVILDAFKKGIRDFDAPKAYLAMKAAAEHTAGGIPEFNKKGFLAVDDENESVSKTLEYAYDNWCIAQMAKELHHEDEAALYLKRSLGYRNLFDHETGFMRPRINGDWLSPFYPAEINNHFTEANSWQYSFYAPHDISGLIALHGGKEVLEKKLDMLFTTREKNKGRQQADVTGLIGQYAHGNEPSHHIAYLYNYIGNPGKTIQRVRQIADAFYKDSPEGLIGNEDCGQMSAWYVFSALGFYPVCPGTDEYVTAVPRFSDIKLNFESGKSLVITGTKGNDPPALRINGNSVLRSFLHHHELVSGGELEFLPDERSQLSASGGNSNNRNPGQEYGRGTNTPSAEVEGISLLPAPLIKSPAQVFRDRMKILMKPVGAATGTLHYTIDGPIPTRVSPIYTGPVEVTSTASVKCICYTETDSSAISEARFYKLKHDAKVRLISKPDAQYTAHGGDTFIDGVPSDLSWRKGNWVGVQGRDLEFIVDFSSPRDISYLSLSALQDTRSWIIFPTTVSYYISKDGKKFTLLGTVPGTAKPDDYREQLGQFGLEAQAQGVRSLKIVAVNAGKLPEWHLGKGGDSYIFADELEIR